MFQMRLFELSKACLHSAFFPDYGTQFMWRRNISEVIGTLRLLRDWYRHSRTRAQTNTRRHANVCVMLVYRRRRWTNIPPTLGRLYLGINTNHKQPTVVIFGNNNYFK